MFNRLKRACMLDAKSLVGQRLLQDACVQNEIVKCKVWLPAVPFQIAQTVAGVVGAFATACSTSQDHVVLDVLSGACRESAREGSVPQQTPEKKGRQLNKIASGLRPLAPITG